MTLKLIQNDSENKYVNKEAIFHEFVNWYATPTTERTNAGIITQNDFARHYGVSKDTLSLWKKRSDFGKRVNKVQEIWSRGKTSDVFGAIYKSAMEGNVGSQRLWMKYFESSIFSKPPVVSSSLFQEGDLCNLINVLPEALQDKYNTFLRELLDDSVAFDDDRVRDLEKSINRWQREKSRRADDGPFS